VKNVLTTVVCSFHKCSLKVGIVSAAAREATVSGLFYPLVTWDYGGRQKRRLVMEANINSYVLALFLGLVILEYSLIKNLGWLTTTHFWCFS
jgi:hypothetical protein